jgi:hypothetical protein
LSLRSIRLEESIKKKEQKGMRWPHTLLLGASLDSQELGIVAGGFVQLLPTRSRQQDSEVLAWILSIAREAGDSTPTLGEWVLEPEV